MRNKTKRVIIALLIIIAFLSIKNYITFNDQGNMRNLTKVQEKNNFENLMRSEFWPNCSRIHIKNDNWTEKSFDWIQINSGTQNDPHIIENVTIDAGGLGSAILIENSSAFFIIRNCKLINSGSGNNAGIFLNQTSNGQLVNNNCSYNNYNGICLHDKCKNNILLNNTANNNVGHGIRLEINCTDNIILGNIAYFNGQSGIFLAQNCYNNSLLENEIKNNGNNGISLGGYSYNNTISGNIANDNDYYGISLGGYSYNNTISGNVANDNDYYGIYLSHCYSNTISGNIANDNYYIGIYIYRYSNNNTISGNIVNNNRWWGINLDEYCDNNKVSGNIAYNNGEQGIYVTFYCNNNTISENTANNNGYGIYIYYYCDDNIVLNNTFKKNFYGVRIRYYSNNNTVLENIVNNNTYGVEVYYDCDDNRILNNTINNNEEEGIHVQYESYNNMISGNEINDNKNSGIFIEGRDCDNTTILGNTLNSNYYGIYLVNVYRIELSGNKLDKCGLMIEGSFDQLSSLLIYPNNTVNERSIYYYVNKSGLNAVNFTEGGQVLLFYCKNSIISNLNLSQTSIGIYLYRSSNVTISNNIVNNNSHYGIYLYDSSNVTISNNVINDNTQYGIYLVEDCDNNTILENYLYFNSNWAVFISSANCDENLIERNVLVSNNGKFIENLGNNTLIKLNIISNTPPSILIEVLEESFTTTEFIVTIRISCEIIGFEISDPYIQMWWNGNKVPSSNIAEIGNGLYNVSLNPIYTNPGEAPILLNMTISAIYHLDKYFEIYIAVERPESVKLLQIEMVEHSYSTKYFNFTFFVFNESGQGIDAATIQMWWDGIDMSADIENLGNGYYFVSLDAILVVPGEDPILLNMTISASGYVDKYFETYIAVSPSNLEEDTLELEIIDQSFSTEQFNITFFIHNRTGFGIDFATFQIWWNGIDVSADIQNLGNGLYFISLESITVNPGEEPILLSMIISASGYEEKYFETYIAVDPASLLKGEGRPSNGFPLVLTITIAAIGAGAIIGVISIYWFKGRKKKS
ncbi:MAG: right-handed parallel beta-helix repeat-containing protein [Promethearchaeota archaeon]